jgi:hypothetical protein
LFDIDDPLRNSRIAAKSKVGLNMKVTIRTTIDAPLCVKELAAALGKHASFVYAMRGAGFVMRWSSELRCEAATVEQAKQWLSKTGWRKR